MKIFILLLPIVLSFDILKGQVPLGFSFQTIIRDSEGKVQKNQSVNLRFSVLEGSESGSNIYSETHSKTTNEFGVVNLTVGAGTPVSGSFSSIVWGSNIHFLKTEIDPTGGSSYGISTTSQLMSVPYAMYAQKADTTLKSNIPNGSTIGDILYWNNEKWNLLSNGNQGDFLRINENGIPIWSSFLGYLVDIDGNVYETIKIGNQAWMSENLKTTHYNDGSSILKIVDNTEWSNNTSGAYCFYDNDSTTNAPLFGALYNWYAANTGKLCPTGWHVPTDEEWTVLTEFLGGADVAGGKMKTTGTEYWNAPNEGATNESGFNGLPGGSRNHLGEFSGKNLTTFFWNTKSESANNSYRLFLLYDFGYLGRYFDNNNNGYSNRCIKNQ